MGDASTIVGIEFAIDLTESHSVIQVKETF